MGVSENSGTPKSSILIGFSIINHPFWGTPIFGNTHIAPESDMHIKKVFGALFLPDNLTNENEDDQFEDGWISFPSKNWLLFWQTPLPRLRRITHLPRRFPPPGRFGKNIPSSGVPVVRGSRIAGGFSHRPRLMFEYRRYIRVFPKNNQKIGGKPPKWMVYNGKPYVLKWMICGYHYFRKHPYITCTCQCSFMVFFPLSRYFLFVGCNEKLDLPRPRKRKVFFCNPSFLGSSIKNLVFDTCDF